MRPGGFVILLVLITGSGLCHGKCDCDKFPWQDWELDGFDSFVEDVFNYQKLFTSVLTEIALSLQEQTTQVKLDLDGVRLELRALQESMVTLALSTNEQMKDTEDRIDGVAKNLERLRETGPTPPVGFVYIQYHLEDSPQKLYPYSVWLDITSSYEGLFFRAAGGNSSNFGQLQSQSSPGLTNFRYDKYQGSCLAYPTSAKFDCSQRADGSRGGFLMDNGGNYIRFGYTYEDNEVRPANAAVKIWKRMR